MSAAVLHVQQAFVLLLDATLFALPLRPFPQRPAEQKPCQTWKRQKKNRQTCCFSFQPKATNQHRCGRIDGNAVQPILWAVCGECESWRPIKRKRANQTSIRSKFSINSFSFSSPATKRVAESGFVVVVLSHSSLDFYDMLLLLGGILVFYLHVLLDSLLAFNKTNQQQHHMYYVRACVRVCVYVWGLSSPHSPLLLRIILAETPLALLSLGDVAVAFSSELTSAPCCFSRSVSVLGSSNRSFTATFSDSPQLLIQSRPHTPMSDFHFFNQSLWFYFF